MPSGNNSQENCLTMHFAFVWEEKLSLLYMQTSENLLPLVHADERKWITSMLWE
jgi:hypothetical protein